MIETKSKKSAWIAFLAVLAFLALVFGLDQWIKPTDSLGMLLIVLQKGSVYALAAVSMNLLNGYTGLFSLDDGYYYISHNGRTPEKEQFSRVYLYRWTGNTPAPLERVE